MLQWDGSPTATGLELGIGRIGPIVGPLLGAMVVGLPVEKLYMWSSLPFALGAAICFAIWKLNEARLQPHPELPAVQRAYLGAGEIHVDRRA
jgi:MFS transporter, AAHS family, 4-hydroxybenzoate transporter